MKPWDSFEVVKPATHLCCSVVDLFVDYYCLPGDDSEASSRHRRGPLHNSATRAQPASQSWQRLRPRRHDGRKLLHRVGGGTNSQSGWARGNMKPLKFTTAGKVTVIKFFFLWRAVKNEWRLYFSCGKYRDGDLEAGEQIGKSEKKKKSKAGQEEGRWWWRELGNTQKEERAAVKEWRMEKKRGMDGVRWRKMSGSSGCVYQTGVGPCLTERDVGAVSGDSSHVSGEQEESGWTSFWMCLNNSNELALPFIFIWKHLQIWGKQARSAAYLISCSLMGRWERGEGMLIIDEWCSEEKKKKTDNKNKRIVALESSNFVLFSLPPASAC